MMSFFIILNIKYDGGHVDKCMIAGEIWRPSTYVGSANIFSNFSPLNLKRLKRSEQKTLKSLFNNFGNTSFKLHELNNFHSFLS